MKVKIKVILWYWHHPAGRWELLVIILFVIGRQVILLDLSLIRTEPQWNRFCQLNIVLFSCLEVHVGRRRSSWCLCLQGRVHPWRWRRSYKLVDYPCQWPWPLWVLEQRFRLGRNLRARLLLCKDFIWRFCHAKFPRGRPDFSNQ